VRSSYIGFAGVNDLSAFSVMCEKCRLAHRRGRNPFRLIRSQDNRVLANTDGAPPPAQPAPPIVLQLPPAAADQKGRDTHGSEERAAGFGDHESLSSEIRGSRLAIDADRGKGIAIDTSIQRHHAIQRQAR